MEPTNPEERIALLNFNAAVQMRTTIENIMTSRLEWLRRLNDTRVNMEAECGYTPIRSLTWEDYMDMYIKNPYAARVVEVLPEESWCCQPVVYERDETKVETEFETAWDWLCRRLRGVSWYNGGSENNTVWEYLKRLDTLSRIGAYGVLLIGYDDTADGDLSKPVPGFINKIEDDLPTPKPAGANKGKAQLLNIAKTKLTAAEKPGNEVDEGDDEESAKPIPTFKPKRKVMFLRPFHEDDARITSYVNDPKDPRNGQPEMYELRFWNYEDTPNTASAMPTQETKTVHWTRILHIPSDGIGSNDFIGIPAQRPIYHYLQDLIKVHGAAAEGYWKGAFPGISIESIPQLGAEVAEMMDEGQPDPEDPSKPSAKEALKSMMADYMHGLQRYLVLMGFQAKSLAPQFVDPTQAIDVIITAICIKLGIPKRIFMGSERGELASGQDDDTWNDRIRTRQHDHLTLRVIVPFVDMLIRAGALPIPEEFKVHWPDMKTANPVEEADVAQKLAQAITAFVSGNGEAAMTLEDFYVHIMGFSEEDAKAISEAAAEQVETKEAELEAKYAENGLDPLSNPPPQPGLAPEQQPPPAKGGFPPKPGAGVKPPVATKPGKPF